MCIFEIEKSTKSSSGVMLTFTIGNLKLDILDCDNTIEKVSFFKALQIIITFNRLWDPGTNLISGGHKGRLYILYSRSKRSN